MTRPPHLEFLAALAKARVDYLLIGVMGINHYAEGPSQVYHTEDLDVLLSPSQAALRRACAALTSCGYELRSNGESLGPMDAFLARRILERRAVVNGFHSHGIGVDLVLEAAPFTFAQWKKRRRAFRVDRLRVYCADLQMLLKAKQTAARPKDKAFLALYKAARKPSR